MDTTLQTSVSSSSRCKEVERINGFLAFYVIVPVTAIKRAECNEQGRFPFVDEFCATPAKGNMKGVNGV